MGRKRTLTLGGLNIVAHDKRIGSPPPRLPDEVSEYFFSTSKENQDRLGSYYVWLLGRAIGRNAVLRGDRWGRLATLGVIRRLDSSPILVGKFDTFTQISMDEPWLNLSAEDAASDLDKAAVRVPDHLKPHYKPGWIGLAPHRHRLYFDATLVGPTLAQKYFQTVFDQLVGRETVRVSIMQDHAELERIKTMHLRSLSVLLFKPNAEPQGFGPLLEERLRRHNADQVRLTLDSKTGELEIDENLATALEYAVRDGGVVEARGIDPNGPGRVEKTRTSDHPFSDVSTYPDSVDETVALMSRIAQLVATLGGEQ